MIYTLRIVLDIYIYKDDDYYDYEEKPKQLEKYNIDDLYDYIHNLYLDEFSLDITENIYESVYYIFSYNHTNYNFSINRQSWYNDNTIEVKFNIDKDNENHEEDIILKQHIINDLIYNHFSDCVYEGSNNGWVFNDNDGYVYANTKIIDVYFV